jgi:hypothetical protein
MLQLCNMVRCGVFARPRLAAEFTVEDFEADVLHLGIKHSEVAFKIAATMSKSHPTPAIRGKYTASKHAWREELKAGCGVHRNKAGFDGNMSHLIVAQQETCLTTLESHPDHVHLKMYMECLRTMLDQAWAREPNKQQFAAAAAKLHCLLVAP